MDIFFTNGAKLPELQKARPDLLQLPAARTRATARSRRSREKAGVAGKQTWTSATASPRATSTTTGTPTCSSRNTGTNTLYHNNGDGTFTDVTDGSGLDGKPKDVAERRGRVLRLRQRRAPRPGGVELHLLDPADGQALPERDGVEIYCYPKHVRERAAPPLPQPRQREVRGRDREVRLRERSPARAWASASPTSTTTAGMDVFIANDTEPNFLFMNQGNGTFKEVGLPRASRTTTAARRSRRWAPTRGTTTTTAGWTSSTTTCMGQIWGLFQNERRQVLPLRLAARRAWRS